MKEHTRITVVQITQVAREEQDVVDFITSKDAKDLYKKSMASAIKQYLQADDVVMLSVQDFVADVEEK